MKTKTILLTGICIFANAFLWGADSDVPTLPADNKNVVVYKSDNWSTSLAKIGTWLRYDSESGTWVESTGASAQPTSNEIVVIGREHPAGVAVFQFEDANKGATIDSIFFESYSADMANRNIILTMATPGNYDTPSLKILHDLVVTNSSTVGSNTVNIIPRGTVDNGSYRISNLEIGGNVYVGNDTAVKSSILKIGSTGDASGSNNGPISKLKIGGDIYVRETSLTTNQIHFNVGATYYSDAKASGTLYDINNPDVEIGGAIHVIGDARSFFYVMQNGTGKARVCTFSVGGLDGNFSFLLANETPSDYNNGENVNYFVLVLTQGAGTTYTHHTTPELGATIGENGDNDFDAANVMKIVMQGEGTQILKSGVIRFHGGVEVNNGTLLVNGKAGGADGLAIDKTVWTHGDLEMNGGTFGIYNNTAGAGIFTFTDCYWKSGTLVLGTYDDAVDVLSFSGSFMDGPGEISDVVFTFDGDCVALLNQQKLIDCSEFSSYFTADKFKAEDAFILGEWYKAEFEIKDDGLYMQYVAVPEPAAFAALFGIFACAFALTKRNRRK